MPDALQSQILDALRTYWGYDTLRPLQLDAIRAGIAQRDSLVVLPTGGGKSLCYQLPPLITGKLAVVISPLISLMKDQVDGLKLADYPAAAMYSGMSSEQLGAARRQALEGKLKLLLVAPERVLTESFLAFLRTLADRSALGGISIDEAHCISQWGHDFRPEYRRLAELRQYFPELSLHAYTATATPRVRQDIVQQLALRDPEVLVGIFDRPNLTYRILPRVRQDDQVEEVIRRQEGRASIVYCISRKDTEHLAEELTQRGLPAEAYHAGLDHKVRARVQEDFANERLNTVVATVAFGMGIDRSDVRCVVHASMPKTVEHYQQETGRAGRDGLPSECVLFYSSADPMRWRRLMERPGSDSETPPDPAALEAQFVLLDHMQQLCNGARCRHKSLSEYFGQSYPNPNCGACDLCLNELSPVADASTVAKKIISCVARLYQASNTGFGAAYVADVLRGGAIKRVLERRHDELSTFGLLRMLEKERIVSYINQMIDSGVLMRAPGEYPVILTCAGSMAVLKDRQEVALFDPVQTVEPPRRVQRERAGGGSIAADTGPDLTTEERGLFEALRLLRRGIAAERGVPPFMIFADTTLEELSRVRPGTPEAFGGIRGVGARKLEEFGERFVGRIVEYCAEHKLAHDAAPTSRPPSRPRPSSGERSARSGTLSSQKRMAFELFARGASVAEVAAQTQRALSTSCEYLVDWIQQNRPGSVAKWVDDGVYATIVETATKLSAEQMKPIFEHHGGSISYDQIRIVMTHRKVVAHEPRA